MLLNDQQEPFDPETIAFERWCGDRIIQLPSPELWQAILRAKHEFLRGRIILIRRSKVGKKKVLVEILTEEGEDD